MSLAAGLARVRAQLGDTHAVFARQRAEREAREQRERELHEAQRAAGWTRGLVLPVR